MPTGLYENHPPLKVVEINRICREEGTELYHTCGHLKGRGSEADPRSPSSYSGRRTESLGPHMQRHSQSDPEYTVEDHSGGPSVMP